MGLKEERYNSLIEKNKGSLIRICRIYTYTDEGFEDLYQEVLLNVWRSFESFDNKSKISTWIYRIVLNVSIKYKSRKKKFVKNSDKFLYTQVNEDASVKIEKKESISLLKECISELNDTDKSLILLYLEELPYKNIAEIIGISENYVAVKLKRIKNKLFNCLKSKNYG